MRQAARPGVGPEALAPVEVFERRELLEVALHAGGEFVAVAVAFEEAQLGLAAGTLAISMGLEPEPLRQPRPFGSDHRENGEREERDRQPTHPAILAPGAKPRADAGR